MFSVCVPSTLSSPVTENVQLHSKSGWKNMAFATAKNMHQISGGTNEEFPLCDYVVYIINGKNCLNFCQIFCTTSKI